jgi:hypothetical protein
MIVNIFKRIKAAKARPFPKVIKPGKISGETARKLLAVAIASATSNTRMK